MTEHHPLFAPSSADRRCACPGSGVMEALYPDVDTPASVEGTAAHAEASALIEGISRGVWPEATDFVYDVREYVHVVGARMRELGAFAYPSLGIERTVRMDRILPGLFGTPDCWLFDPKHGILDVYELKYGHIPVEVAWNKQLTCGVVGILAELGLDSGLADQHLTVRYHVAQPRAHHRDGTFRTWETPASNLRGLINQLRTAAEAVTGDHPQCVPNPYCKNCKARHDCPALAREAATWFTLSMDPEPQGLTPEQWSVEALQLRQAIATMQARLTGAEEQINVAVESGVIVPGWTRQPTYGRQAWTVSTGEVLALGDMIGVNLRKPEEPCTPKQAITKGLDPEIARAYSSIPLTGVTLVYDGSTAKEVFTK